MKMHMRLLLADPGPVPAPPPPLVRSEAFPERKLWGALIIGATTFILGFLFLYFLRGRIRIFLKNRKKSKGSLDYRERKLRRFLLQELQKATGNFSVECLVGAGAFGNVYRGIFEGDGAIETLAIKRAHADSYMSLEEFQNEVRLISRVNHENLVKLVGYCEEAGQKILVYEYVPNGSLLDYMAGRRQASLTWLQRANVAIGAARGIAHLHGGCKPSIIHRDLKPSNILLGEEFQAKISDFGLVKSGPVGDESHVSSQIKGTPGYLDPSYCSTFHLSTLSDVYSFGVILLQLIAAKPAVDTSRPLYTAYHIIDWVSFQNYSLSITHTYNESYITHRQFFRARKCREHYGCEPIDGSMQHRDDAEDGATRAKVCG
ncbi:hypothetical protein AMTRI_Chr09g34650 [Amborella trichopoda]